jgi:hypothetical protein
VVFSSAKTHLSTDNLIDCGKVAQNISEAVPGVWATYFRIPANEVVYIEKYLLKDGYLAL